jgi:hypothetical protein
MGTLGQTLRDAHPAKPLNLEAHREAEDRRIRTLVESLESVLAKAKVDIVEAIRAGADEFDIQSKVDDSQPVYRFLRGIHDKRWAASTDNAQLLPLWDQFVAWARSEDLHIELVSHLPDTRNGEQVGGWYILIRARSTV